MCIYLSSITLSLKIHGHYLHVKYSKKEISFGFSKNCQKYVIWRKLLNYLSFTTMQCMSKMLSLLMNILPTYCYLATYISCPCLIAVLYFFYSIRLLLLRELFFKSHTVSEIIVLITILFNLILDSLLILLLSSAATLMTYENDWNGRIIPIFDGL